MGLETQSILRQFQITLGRRGHPPLWLSAHGIAKFPHDLLDLLLRQGIRLEEVLPGDVREAATGQPSGQLVAENGGGICWEGHHNLVNDAVEWLAPVVVAEDLPARFPDRALKRALAEGTEGEAFSLDDLLWVPQRRHRGRRRR